MSYCKIIKEICESRSIEADPRHIEGFMRLQYGSLGHLSRQEIANECELFDKAKDMADWEENAQSYGL